MPLVWLALPNWLPDDPKFQSGEYKADVRSGKRVETWPGGCERDPGPTNVREVRNKANVRSGKRAETWSGGCERDPGPTNVHEVRNPANVMRRNVELAFREVVRYDDSKSKWCRLYLWFWTTATFTAFLFIIYSGAMLQNYNGGPFRLWEREASWRSCIYVDITIAMV